MSTMFGAFLVGMALSQNLDKRNEAHEMVYQFVMYFFAPLYFVSVGLRTNFFGSFDPVLVLVVLAVACVGKVIGATLGARCSASDAAGDGRRLCHERPRGHG